ncbi:MAG: hypothetical protein JO044_11270 [Mycobacteriaceae bacterium]|nr:hypothetical protein [Mycobacteriaceae bacterium]MBV9639364.1 hypothetical protein [Mycobacteriaceae bacterium]
MRVRLRYLIAAGTVAAFVTAPAAVADDSFGCLTGPNGECASPDNAQLNDSPPPEVQNPDAGGFYQGPYAVPWDEGSH